jgi:ribosomal protein S3AE
MIKILGGKALTKALKVSGCVVSESAKIAIEKAGGTIIPVKPIEVAKPEAPKVVKTPEASKAPKAPKAKAEKTDKAPSKTAAKPKTDKPAKK